MALRHNTPSPTRHSKGTGTLSPVGNLHDLKVDHSFPTNAGVKNQWSYNTSDVSVHFHGVDKNWRFLIKSVAEVNFD